ncbi:hypothetical protein [Streptomyces sp. NPDC056480]|uniref:hypothetical protein n=1 Tax=Streptomyces sp. NPDC056480 TaxID=3345833 RepID=UPI0036762E5D
MKWYRELSMKSKRTVKGTSAATAAAAAVAVAALMTGPAGQLQADTTGTTGEVTDESNAVSDTFINPGSGGWLGNHNELLVV